MNTPIGNNYSDRSFIEDLRRELESLHQDKNNRLLERKKRKGATHDISSGGTPIGKVTVKALNPHLNASYQKELGARLLETQKTAQALQKTGIGSSSNDEPILNIGSASENLVRKYQKLRTHSTFVETVWGGSKIASQNAEKGADLIHQNQIAIRPESSSLDTSALVPKKTQPQELVVGDIQATILQKMGGDSIRTTWVMGALKFVSKEQITDERIQSLLVAIFKNTKDRSERQCIIRALESSSEKQITLEKLESIATAFQSIQDSYLRETVSLAMDCLPQEPITAERILLAEAAFLEDIKGKRGLEAFRDYRLLLAVVELMPRTRMTVQDLKAIGPVLTKRLPVFSQAKEDVLLALKQIPEQKRTVKDLEHILAAFEGIEDWRKPLYTALRAKIIRITKEVIPFEERTGEVIYSIAIFCRTDNTDNSTPEEYFLTLMKPPSKKEIVDICHKTAAIIEDTLGRDVLMFFRNKLFSSIAQISKQERVDAIETLRFIFQGIPKGELREEMLLALLDRIGSEGTQVVEIIKPLFQKVRNTHQLAGIIQVAGVIFQIGQLTEAVLPFLQDIFERIQDKVGCANIRQALCLLPHNRTVDVLEQARALKDKILVGTQRAFILKEIAKIPEDIRKDQETYQIAIQSLITDARKNSAALQNDLMA